MTTITLDSKAIDWIEKTEYSVQIWYTTLYGEKDFLEEDPWTCDIYDAEDVLKWTYEALEENTGEQLTDHDKEIIKRHCMPYFQKWCRQDENC